MGVLNGFDFRRFPNAAVNISISPRRSSTVNCTTMFQTVLLGGSFDANIPRLPPQTVVADCSPQQMEQLLAQAELEGGNVVADHPSPEDVLLAPLVLFYIFLQIYNSIDSARSWIL